MVVNETDEKWRTKEFIGQNYLLGYYNNSEVITNWGDYPTGEEPEFDLSKEVLSKIYKGLDFTTSEEIKAKKAIDIKNRKILLLVLTIWLCAIPALIAYLGWSSPIFSFLALMYSWYIAIQKGRELWGHKKKSTKQIAKEKEEQEKEHHHYHCKQNPEAFLRLRNENFKNDRLKREKKEIDKMKN